MELVIASSNTHKVLVLREILKEFFPQHHVLSLFDFPKYTPAEKNQAVSFGEKAAQKALHAAQTVGCICIAEQWGLIIPSLSSEQSEAAFTDSSVRRQTQKILELMKAKSELERYAYLETAVAIATPKGVCKEAVARCEGMICEEEKGKANYDFDSIFIKHDYSKTLAELPASTHMRISYRRKAIEKLLPFIEHALSH